MKQTQDEYYEKLEEAAERQAEHEWLYGGGYEASKGDYEGAILAREEYNSGRIS